MESILRGESVLEHTKEKNNRYRSYEQKGKKTMDILGGFKGVKKGKNKKKLKTGMKKAFVEKQYICVFLRANTSNGVG